MVFRFKREIAALMGVTAFALSRRSKESPSARLALPLGLAALGLVALPRPLTGLAGLSVVITGGSRGLGYAFAQLLLKKGANVTLLARDPDELERASLRLGDLPGRLFTVHCDVTKTEQIDWAFAEARARFGKIDMLINNAGTVSVGPFASLDDEDFKAQVRVHMKAVVEATRLIRPYFHQNGGGRIINISSIGGAVPVPHMAAYCASKFGVAGFSEAVGAELKAENIHVTTAYPGLMRTGSPIQAVFKGDAQKEFAWFASSDNSPLISVSADRAAGWILRAALDNRHSVVVSLPAKIGVLGHALFPELYLATMDLVARLLPKGTSRVRYTGAEIRASEPPLPFEGRMRAAEERFNQEEKTDAEFNMSIRDTERSPQT